MSFKDAYGAILELLRTDVAVIAIAANRIGPNPPAGTLADTTAWVRLVDMPASRNPFGPGSGRMGVHRWTGIAQCYGPTRDIATGQPIATGAATARQLAGAVSDRLNNHRPTVVKETLLRAISARELSGRLEEPETHRIFYTVRIEAYADDQAVAS